MISFSGKEIRMPQKKSLFYVVGVFAVGILAVLAVPGLFRLFM